MPENNILSEDVSDQSLCLIQKTYFRFSVKDRFTGNSSATDWYHDDDGLPLVSYPITSRHGPSTSVVGDVRVKLVILHMFLFQ
jgi:hypothetical protein